MEGDRPIKIALIAIIAILLIAAFVILISTDWFFQDSSPTSTPEATVRSLFSATNDNDCDKYLSCFTPELRDEIYCDVMAAFGASDYVTLYNLQTRLESMEADRAEVYAEWDYLFEWMGAVETGHASDTILLERMGSDWFISLVNGDTDKERAYESVKPQIQNGVIEYAVDHNGALPPTVTGSSTVINTPLGNVVVEILDICSIIGGDRILLAIPDGCYEGAGAADDNCDGATTPCTGCLDTNHYTWYIDDSGNVYSRCTGSDCTSTADDGYQGVWP